MSLKELSNIQLEYKTLEDNVIDEFYVPCLKEAKIYKRAVGFFSSSILLQISKGLGTLAKNGGKIKLLVSPKLEKNDYEAIKNGYELKDYVYKMMDDSFDENIQFEQKEDRFTLLSYLIVKGILDIRIAVVQDETHEKAMYHEKLGIMIDDDDNIVSFTGSANETNAGFKLNYECIDVFCSWNSDDAAQRCSLKDFRFDQMWDDNEKGLVVFPFPQVIKDKLIKYNNYDNVDFVQLDKDLVKIHLAQKVKGNLPSMDDVTLYEYQEEAIDKWVKSGFRGIFDMATGTGKTFTGLGALVQLVKEKKRIVAVICCPYIHLVEQWCEEAQIFNLDPIKCYGSVNYKEKLKRQVRKFKNKRSDFLCIITTNSTFQSEYLQSMIDINLKNTLLMVDEAHNFGAGKVAQFLEKDYPFRLALSATLDRYGDEEGTKRLYDFFGKKCIEYDLGRAIQENKLTPYKYYPVLVSLTDDELEKYNELTLKIRKYHFDDNKEIPQALKTLLVKRARLVAGAKNKIEFLRELIIDYKKNNNLLVYCGAVKYNDDEINDEDIQGRRQIQVVTDMLNDELGIVSTKFTSEENAQQRKEIILAYKNEIIQSLVAIKCLDEGMNIPAIKTAFILASSTNPKEYIQRRGRVLRKYPGKAFAEIYDFITLPRDLDEVISISPQTKDMEIGLVKRELVRLIDFSNLSMNPSYSNECIDEIKYAYDLDTITEGDISIYE